MRGEERTKAGSNRCPKERARSEIPKGEQGGGFSSFRSLESQRVEKERGRGREKTQNEMHVTHERGRREEAIARKEGANQKKRKTNFLLKP